MDIMIPDDLVRLAKERYRTDDKEIEAFVFDFLCAILANDTVLSAAIFSMYQDRVKRGRARLPPHGTIGGAHAG